MSFVGPLPVDLPIPGWPEYTISRHGQVRRIAPAPRWACGKIVKWQIIRKNKYAKVALSRRSNVSEYLVHRLVAMTYIGHPGALDVCHNDGQKWHNSVGNLRIDTRTGNMADQIKFGLTPRGERSGSNKYPEARVRVIKARLLAGESVIGIHLETGMPKPTLYGIRSGQTWGWL